MNPNVNHQQNSTMDPSQLLINQEGGIDNFSDTGKLDYLKQLSDVIKVLTGTNDNASDLNSLAVQLGIGNNINVHNNTSHINNNSNSNSIPQTIANNNNGSLPTKIKPEDVNDLITINNYPSKNNSSTTLNQIPNCSINKQNEINMDDDLNSLHMYLSILNNSNQHNNNPYDYNLLQLLGQSNGMTGMNMKQTYDSQESEEKNKVTSNNNNDLNQFNIPQGGNPIHNLINDPLYAPWVQQILTPGNNNMLMNNTNTLPAFNSKNQLDNYLLSGNLPLDLYNIENNNRNFNQVLNPNSKQEN
jgi:hypothetical protein